MSHFVRIPLSTGPSRALFSATILLGLCGFAAFGLRIAIAQQWGESADMRLVARAARMDPDNPELHYRAGLLRFLQQGDTASGIAELRRAVQLNPSSGRYWLALGQACFVRQDRTCAAEAFERAVKEAPLQPGLEWEAAAYYAANGDADRFSAHAARLLQLQPEAAQLVFAFAWDTAAGYDPG